MGASSGSALRGWLQAEWGQFCCPRSSRDVADVAEKMGHRSEPLDCKKDLVSSSGAKEATGASPC